MTPEQQRLHELKVGARNAVINDEQMTVEQAEAWFIDPGWCACLGGKGCCIKVTAAARAVLDRRGEHA